MYFIHLFIKYYYHYYNHACLIIIQRGAHHVKRITRGDGGLRLTQITNRSETEYTTLQLPNSMF